MSPADDIEITLARIRQAGTVVVLRLRDHSNLLSIARTLADVGLDVMEVTFDHPDTAGSLAALVDALGDRVLIGAGTVRSREHVQRAADAGARFCVSAYAGPSVIAATCEAGMAPLPGVVTATEIELALEAGAHMVKLFPAGPLGAAYLRAIRGPFRDVEFVPTGGIAHDALLPWYEAGAVAVGLGSDLIGDAATQVDDSTLSDLARRAAVVRRQADQRAPRPPRSTS